MGPQAPLPGKVILAVPFENSQRDPKFDWIGDGLAELATERLAGLAAESARAGEKQEIQVLTREQWAGALERMGLPASTRFTRATLLKIAEEMEADEILFGRYSTDGQGLRIAARFLRTHPPSLSPEAAETGTLEELMELQARLVWKLCRLEDSAAGACCGAPGKGRLPARLDAFEHYVRGLGAAEETQRLKYFREAARLAPEWDAPAFALGKSYFLRGDCGNALQWLAKVDGEDPERGAESGFYAGVCHLLRGDPARAQAAFSASLGYAPLAETYNNLGVALERQGQWGKAAANFVLAQQLDADQPEYWFNLGVASLWAGEKGVAREMGVRAFRETLRLKPDDAEARAWLVAALERAGRATEAAGVREESPVDLPAVTLPAPAPAVKATKQERDKEAEGMAPAQRIGRVKTSLEFTWRARNHRGDGNGGQK